MNDKGKIKAREIKLHNRRVRLYPIDDNYEGQSFFIEFQHYDETCEKHDYNAYLGGVHTYTGRKSRTIRVKLSEEALLALKFLITELEEI